MLSLEQVRSLEDRVEKALSYIDELTEENASLRERLGGYESRIKDLEVLVRDFQQDQGRIEEGILNALEKLNAFEGAAKPGLARAEGKAGVKASTERGAPPPVPAEAKSAPDRKASSAAEPEVKIDEIEEPIEEILDEDILPLPQKPSGELDIF